jgi:glycosyltransferase involved in cell wall biosynthesis
MKLIVMVPCLNEEATLPSVIQTIPKSIPGIDVIETLIIDDGSTDRTVEVARQLGVTHIVRLKQHQGLARAFQEGIDACLELGADIIVNTDGDNQYSSGSIPQLVQPILQNRAHIVIGDRQTQTIAEFSPLKKALQKLGCWAVRTLSGERELGDAVSGFRAYSRYAASRIYLTNSFSYTIETIIQASKRGLHIESVPISINAKTRPSRLFRNLRGFIARSLNTMVRSYLLYEPLRVLLVVTALSLLLALGSAARLVQLEITDPNGTHILPLLLAIIFSVGGVLTAILALLADHIAINRKLLEELVWREKAGSQGRFAHTVGRAT